LIALKVEYFPMVLKIIQQGGVFLKLSFTSIKEGQDFVLRIGIIKQEGEEFFWEYLPDRASAKIFTNKYPGVVFQKRGPFQSYPCEELTIMDLLGGVTAVASTPLKLKEISEDAVGVFNKIIEEARFRKYYGRDDAPDEWCLPERRVDLKDF
jgi:hypothetical protein